jgi:hypothetical protein
MTEKFYRWVKYRRAEKLYTQFKYQKSAYVIYWYNFFSSLKISGDNLYDTLS